MLSGRGIKLRYHMLLGILGWKYIKKNNLVHQLAGDASGV
jgi:hypothetical protein